MVGIEGDISLRPASPLDESLLLHWANDPQVRANSFSPNPIASSDHHHWFQQGLINPNRLMFIAVAPNGCPIGQIRFDLNLNNSQNDLSEAIVDLSLDRCLRGQGLSVKLLVLGLFELRQHWGSSIHAVAEVLSSNHASNACFSRAGFVKELDQSFSLSKSVSVVRWRLLWQNS